MTQDQTDALTAAYRLFRLGLHFLRGALTAALVFPLASPRQRARMECDWSRRLLAILHITAEIRGELAAVPAQGVLVVANHISWVDIFLVLGERPVRFVSKAEVRDWPVIGWLSEKAGTLFIERARKRDTHRMKGSVQAALQEGGMVAVFPEGTTSDGSKLRHFHTSLLQAAIDCGSLVQPVAIRYRHADGTLDATPAYIDNMSLGDSLRRILAARHIRAELAFLPPIPAQGKTRRELAIEAETLIASALRLANPRSDTGTPAGLPAAAR